MGLITIRSVAITKAVYQSVISKHYPDIAHLSTSVRQHIAQYGDSDRGRASAYAYLLLNRLLCEKDCALNGLERVVFDAQGKGRLRDYPLFFNVSHSQDVVAVAVADTPVGIDVQVVDEKKGDFLRKFFGNDNLCFGGSEKEKIIDLTAQWCLLESYAKRVGGAIGEIMRLSKRDIRTVMSQEALIGNSAIFCIGKCTYCIATVCNEKCNIEQVQDK